MQNLQQVRHLRELIASHNSELQRLRAVNDLRSSLANAGSGGSGGGGGSTVGMAILRAEKRVDLEAKILAEINEMLGLWDELHDAIQSVEDRDERLVLRMRYIDELNIREIAGALHVSVRQAWRIHDEAVKKLKVGTECH